MITPPDAPAAYQWNSPEATARAGESLGACLQAGDVIGLIGDLGAGKTLFVQGIARGLGVPPEIRVTSPTFTIINEYSGGRLPLYHADLYRIERASELDEIGLDELIRRGDGVVCVEWCDRFPVLGRDYLAVDIRVCGEHERRAQIAAAGSRSQALAQTWTAGLH